MKETNMEHFRGEIEETGYRFGIVDGKIVDCHEISCDTCGFGKPKCVPRKIKWLMSPYKPEPVLTQREKGFVECVVDGWIVRDQSGNLKWSEILFDRDSLNGMWYLSKVSAEAYLREDYFPFITWEDEEPWSVEELRKLKVQNEDNI